MKYPLPRVPDLRSITVVYPHMKEPILALPKNSLQPLTYLDPGPSRNLDPIF